MKLPPEVRNMIWGELLLVENNLTMADFPVHYGSFTYGIAGNLPPSGLSFTRNAKLLIKAYPAEVRGSWGLPSNATSIFRVNRQVSKETLSFFSRENAFVSLQAGTVSASDDTIGRRTILHDFVARSIPLRLRKDSLNPPEVLLSICLWQDHRETVIENTARGIKNAIMPGRYLPILVQVINSLHSPLLNHPDLHYLTRSACILPIDLIIKEFEKSQTLESHYYDMRPLIEKAVVDLKGIRQSDRSSMRMVIHGLDNDSTQELVKSSKLQAWRAEQYVAEAKHLIEKAAVLEEDNNNESAYAQLRIAETMLGFTTSNQGIKAKDTNRRLAFEATAAMFDILVAINRVAKSLSSPGIRAALLGSRDNGPNRLAVLDQIRDAQGEVEKTYIQLSYARHPHSPFRDVFLAFPWLDETCGDTEVTEEMLKNRSRCFINYGNLCFETSRSDYRMLGMGFRFDPDNTELKEVARRYNEASALRPQRLSLRRFLPDVTGVIIHN